MSAVFIFILIFIYLSHLLFIVPLYIMLFTSITYIIFKYVYQKFFRDPNRVVNEDSEAWKEYEDLQEENN